MRVWVRIIFVIEVAFCVSAWAHGDVTPHPVDTTGIAPLGPDWVEPNPLRGSPKAIDVGANGYEHNCAGCHGLNAQSGGMAPDLLKLDDECLHVTSTTRQASCLQDTDDYFKGIVLKGKRNSEGRYVMPAYKSVFTQEAVWSIKAYLDARSLEESGKR